MSFDKQSALALGDLAALLEYGTQVDREAVDWALEVGPANSART
jgi:hypothetical protein